MIDIEKLRNLLRNPYAREVQNDEVLKILDELQELREHDVSLNKQLDAALQVGREKEKELQAAREKIAEQASDIAHLEKVVLERSSWGHRAEQKVARQAEELELLRALLEQSRKNFGTVEVHDEDCEYAYEEDENVPCDCGAREYYDALNACAHIEVGSAKQGEKG